nr:hypothetical protein [Pseudodesulfovibrio sp.]
MSEVEPADFSLSDDFNFRVRVSGETWDGMVDYRVAEIVSELQKAADIAVDEISSFLSVDERSLFFGNNSLIIKSSVSKGCTDLRANWGESFGLHIKGITAKGAVFLTCLAILGATTVGVSSFHFSSKSEILERELQLAKASNDAERLRQTTRLIDAAERIALVGEEPHRSTIKSMEENDLLKFGNNEERYTKDDAGKLYPRRSYAVTDTYYVDDIYEITDLGVVKDTLKLVKQGVAPFVTSIADLNDSDVNKLYQVLKNARLAKRPATLALQVSIKVKQGKPYNATVIGIASAREGSLDLADVVKIKARPAKKFKKEQPQGMLSLFDHLEHKGVLEKTVSEKNGVEE